MTSPTNAAPDDSDVRFSLLEMDGPPARTGARETPPAPTPQPAAPVPAQRTQSPFCACRSELPPSQGLPLAQRNERGIMYCPRCQRPRQPTPRTPPVARAQPVPATQAPADLSEVQTSTSRVALRTEVETTTVQRTAPEPTRLVVAPAGEARLRRGDIIAGAAAEGHGVLVGFQGAGELTRRRLVDILTGAGFPIDWAPAPKSAHAQAGRVLMALNQSGFICRYDRATKRDREAQQRASGLVRDWTARWFVVVGRQAAGTDSVGSAYGRVVMTATLNDAGELRLESTDGDLARRIQSNFTAAVDGEIYTATDVSSWLRAVLVNRFAAASLGGTWYVRRRHALAAEQLLTAFARVRWGSNWLLPALPVASSEELRTGIAQGFADEVAEVLTEYREKREEARAEKRELSSRTAATLHEKLRALVERCLGFAALLGDKHIAPLRARCVKASEEIQECMTGLQVRFGLIFDELRRDAERK